MHKLASFLLGVTLLVILGGCAGFWTKDYGVDVLTVNPEGAAATLQKAIAKSGSSGFVDPSCFDVPAPAGNEDKCKQQRNVAVSALLVASDDLCQAHFKTIYGNDAYYNILTGSVATLTSGAAAIAGGGSAKAALSAISAFSSAERSLINETVYKNMLVTATTKKIREVREGKATAMLLPGTLNKSVAEYPVVLAIRNVVDYHYSCSFMLGLERALEEGTQPGVEAKKARFEQEKRTLELYVAARSAALSVGPPPATKAQVDADAGIAGAIARIAAIEGQLLVLVTGQAPAAESSAADKAALAAKAAAADKAVADKVAADKAKAEADKAKADADKAKSEADKAKADADKAKAEADKAKAIAAKARADAARAAAEKSAPADSSKPAPQK